MSGPIVTTRHDGWAEIRIDREGKRNAMNREARTGLADAFAATADMRAVVLTGTGLSFCSGMDLKERQEDAAQGINTANEEWIAVLLSIRRHPAIFIAAVNGIALGGGSTLINMCDLAIASSNASIGCPEMSFSTYPAMAGPAIQLSGVTRKQAAWLVLTTNRIDGAVAQSWGLVNEHVTPERLLPRASELAVQIAAFDPIALSESKQALDRIPAPISDWAQAMDYGRIVNAAIRSRSSAAKLVAGQSAAPTGTT